MPNLSEVDERVDPDAPGTGPDHPAAGAVPAGAHARRLGRGRPALLDHLVSGHPTELRRLAEQLPRPVRDGAVPVALDRYGLVLRCGAGDVRLPFGAPVRCPRELPGRMRELLARSPAGTPRR
jgi:hypothetical protein